jgi:hypothetical protein
MVYLSGPEAEEESKYDTTVNSELAPFEPGVTKNTKFFSTYEPKHVFRLIISKLELMYLTQEVCFKKWRLSYNVTEE